MNSAMIEKLLRDELNDHIICLRGWLNNDYILDDTPAEQLVNDTTNFMLGATNFAVKLGLDEETVNAIYAEYRDKALELYDNWD